MIPITLKYKYGEKLRTIVIDEDTSINHRLMKDLDEDYWQYIESELNNGKEFIVISTKSFCRIINKRHIHELHLQKEPIEVAL